MKGFSLGSCSPDLSGLPVGLIRQQQEMPAEALGPSTVAVYDRISFQLGIVLKWLLLGSLYYVLDDNRSPCMIFVSFGNSNLAKLPFDEVA